MNPLAKAFNEFSFKLFNSLSKNLDENFFISPLSISTALAMAFTGASSETANQLKNALCLNDLTNEQIFEFTREYMNKIESHAGNGLSLNIANKIFPHQDFQLLEEFVSNLKNHFQSEAQSMNFANSVESANHINNWVEEKTANKIKNLLSPDLLDDSTMMVLVNAIYFKGDWHHKFSKFTTKEEDFFLKDLNTTVKVEMMKSTTKKFHVHKNPGGVPCWTCEFLYAGETTAMTIILPHDDVNIEEVENKLTAEILLNVIFKHDPMPGPVPVHVYIPKFKMEYKKELSDSLKSLGIRDAFNGDADFSLMSSDSKQPRISKVIHQAVVEINEEGTEAAAATAVVMNFKCAMPKWEPPPIGFRCNRPFLFVIHDKESNGVLFMGKFMKPDAI